ncbi:MAG TPA: ATP-binding cassette domain-containing protein [Bacilli bacterium]|jgi:putative ABC transport system permease protein|nr:ATP-binding cassette domain-containing protein [Bacilli bacterium]
MLYLKNIVKDYKAGNISVRALNNITIEFRRQEFVSVLGPSGCGKTTLLNIIGGLDKCTSGDFLIENQDTKTYKDSEWDHYRNDKIGFVFQSFNLIQHLSVWKNVELALTLSGISKIKSKIRVADALERVGLLDQKDKKPNQLSGGQMQRVAIARALVNNPEIILADEPTGALDSVTSKQILDILKEISLERLVVMVTHNQEFANQYSTRIINLKDGCIVSDSNPFAAEKNKEKATKKAKTSMPIVTALALSFLNLKSKIARTMLTIIAGSIGIVAIGLVLSVSNGMTKYINDVQRVALGDYPINITSSVITSPEVSIYSKLKEFPEEKMITVVRGNTQYEHFNAIEDEFFEYLQDMPSEWYTLINYGTSINLNLLYQDGIAYQKVTDSYFYEMTENVDFVGEQYTVLEGKIPQNANEIALVVDSYNCISAMLLYYLGMSYENVETLTFADFMGKEFKLLDNDEYYVKMDNRYYAKGKSYYADLYENAQTTLEIVGILRIEPKATSKLYSSGLLYTKALSELVYERSINSAIVKEQIAAGINTNVFTGLPYEDIIGISSTQTKTYQYEMNLVNLNGMKKINRLYIYTSTFSDRGNITNYINAYQNPESNVKINTSDYTSRITNEFATFVLVLTKVLIIFASISLVVSSIMIAVITYISVIERTKEIGILRSLGARKKDISRVFNAETAIIGFAAGVLGIIGVYALEKPIDSLVKNIITKNTSLTTGLTTFDIVQTKPEYLVLLLVGSIVITILAGMIPAIIASYKSPVDALRNE